MITGRVNPRRIFYMRFLRIFPTGLILSPGHEAILPDIPPGYTDTSFLE